VDSFEVFSFPISIWEVAVERRHADSWVGDARLGVEDCMLRCWFSD